MAKTKNADEKLKYSQIVKNLCDSLGVFLDLASSMMPFEDDYYGDDDDDDNEDKGGPIPF